MLVRDLAAELEGVGNEKANGQAVVEVEHRPQGMTKTVGQVAAAHPEGDPGNARGQQHSVPRFPILAVFVGPGKPVEGHLNGAEGQRAGEFVSGRSRDCVHGMGQDVQARARGQLGRHGHGEFGNQYGKIREKFIVGNGDFAVHGRIVEHGGPCAFGARPGSRRHSGAEGLLAQVQLVQGEIMRRSVISGRS